MVAVVVAVGAAVGVAVGAAVGVAVGAAVGVVVVVSEKTECQSCEGSGQIESGTLCGGAGCSCDGFSGGCTQTERCEDCDGDGEIDLLVAFERLDALRAAWRLAATYPEDRTRFDFDTWADLLKAARKLER